MRTWTGKSIRPVSNLPRNSSLHSVSNTATHYRNGTTPLRRICKVNFASTLRASPLKSPTPTTDRDRTVSRRSEPSSRTALIGEQPNPWELLHPQDAMSRHRGAKPERRCELLTPISLLSPAYLLSVERWPFHTEPPDH